MAYIYSTYEAKAKFSEIIRKVGSGQRIIITYRGTRIAEICPYNDENQTLKDNLERLEADGVLEPPSPPKGDLRPIVKRPGALKRFLESRK